MIRRNADRIASIFLLILSELFPDALPLSSILAFFDCGIVRVASPNTTMAMQPPKALTNFGKRENTIAEVKAKDITLARISDFLRTDTKQHVNTALKRKIDTIHHPHGLSKDFAPEICSNIIKRKAPTIAVFRTIIDRLFDETRLG